MKNWGTDENSSLYRFLKLGGGKINASLVSPTDTYICAKNRSPPLQLPNSDMRRYFLSQSEMKWIFMINAINVLCQRSPFFYEFLYFKILKLAYGNVLVFVHLVCA